MTGAIAMEKGNFFQNRDRYLFEPFEEAFFHWDPRRRTVHMKFAGQDFDVEVPHDHRIFNDAILSGREVDKAAYERGSAEG